MEEATTENTNSTQESKKTEVDTQETPINSQQQQQLNTSTASTSTPTSTQPSQSICCEQFIDTLNKKVKHVNVSISFVVPLANDIKGELDNSNNKIYETSKLIINNSLNESDVNTFLNYCSLWQQK